MGGNKGGNRMKIISKITFIIGVILSILLTTIGTFLIIAFIVCYCMGVGLDRGSWWLFLVVVPAYAFAWWFRIKYLDLGGQVNSYKPGDGFYGECSPPSQNKIRWGWSK
jgi:uncharacterized membrane protein